MKTSIYFVIFFNVFLSLSAVAQQIPHEHEYNNPSFFNQKYWEGVAAKKHLSPSDKAEFLASQKRVFEELKHEHRVFADSELVWVTEPSGRKLGGASTFTGPCTNIDFESGNFSGWTRSTGYHPLYNTAGCCPNANGNQAIMTGTGLDPYGAFPVVFPGGTFSARLGNNAVNGIADRIQQTFLVTPQNVNFTYRYAIVLNDPGHVVSEQPAFTIDMVDSTGFQVPCTMYTVAAASNISGFMTSSVTANNSPVVFKPWTTVALDLTPNLGQVVTIRFTTYDCALGGHFGYAYIDGSCGSFETNIADTTCPGVPYNMCAPAGFSNYFWTGPNSYTNNTQCISVSAAGAYSCQTILSPGCPGPTFNHTLTLRPKPVLSFTPVTTGACALQYTFNSTSSISAGSISTYTWNFGDNNSTFLQSPGHNYVTHGTYPVKFKAISDKGCRDSVIQNITIYPLPVIAFSPPSNCINTVVQFTNTSSIPVGTINSYTWNLGNGVTSNLINPTNSYSTTGPFNVSLSATSDQGCVAALSSTLGIFPPPVVSFSASNFCQGDVTAFTSTTTIASGTLVSYNWNFGDGTSSTVIAPVRTYSNYGSYVVSFSATSNHNCIASDTHTITIHPLPVPSFTASNVCLGNTTTFSNTSQIPFPYTISSYSWNFGSGVTSTLTAPALTYTSWGTHTPTLMAVSNQGCISDTTGNLQVHPLPNISFSPPSACVNTAIQFTNTTNIPNPYSVTSYSWNFGNGNTTNSVNPVYSYTLHNTYTVELTATSNANCATTSSTSLVIWPEPVAFFSASNNCEGSAITFSNSSTIPSPDNIPFYNWNFGNGAVSSLSGPVYTYTSSGTYAVNLTATSNHGCVDNYSVPVTVHPRPAVSVAATSVCPGIATNFSTSFTLNPGSISSYTWNFGDGSAPSHGLNPTKTYTADNTYLVQLSVTSNEGCVGSGTTTALVYPAPVIAFSPPGACANSAINFTNTSTVASGSISSYFWNFGNGNTSALEDPVFVYTNHGQYTVVLSATSDRGCVTTQSISLPIYPVPSSPDFTINPTQCFSSATSFTGQAGIAPGGSISYYNWDFGNGFYSSVQFPSHTYNNVGSYPVTFSATSNNGCIASITKTVTIHPNPSISFSAPAVCHGAATTFTNTSSIQGTTSTIPNWSWNYGDGTSPDLAQTPLPHTYTAFGTYTVTLTGTSNMGCTGSYSTTTAVNPLPVIVFSPPSACVNTAVQFTNSTGIALGSVSSYTWNMGNGYTTNQSNPLYAFNTPGNKQITLTAMSNAGCVSNLTNTVPIYPYPQLTVTPLTNGCANTPVTLIPNYSYSGPLGTGITSYTWDFGNSQSSVVASPTVGATSFVYPTYGTFAIILSANTAGNCMASDSTVITIYPRPNPGFVSQNFCHQDSALFINTSTIPSGTITSHLWFFGDGIVTSSLKDPKHKFSSPNTYTVVLNETSNPEPGVACSHTVAGTVTIHPLPQPAFTSTAVCLGNVTHFKNTTPSGSIVAWGWDFYNNGQTNTAAFEPTNLYTTPGTYTVKLSAINSFNCVNTATRLAQVYSNPTASFTANNVCFQNKTSFANHSTSGSGNSITQYIWNFAGKDSSAIASPQYAFTAPGIHTVELSVRSNLGCRSKYTSTVTVFELPVADFTSRPVCRGEQMQFQNLSYITGTSQLRYRWDYLGGGWDDSSATSAITPYTYPGSGGYIFKLQAISDKGCVHQKAATVMVHANPTAAFNTSKLCTGDQVVFTSLSTSGDGSITAYVWDLNGDNIPDKNGPDPSYSYTLSGDYEAYLTVTTQFGCSDTKSRLLYANPKPLAAYRVDKSMGCPPLCVNFEDLSSISQGSFSTSWNFGDLSPATGVKNPSHCFNSGQYDLKLELVSDSGCVSTLEHPAFLTVYENPVAGFKVYPDEIDEDEPTIEVENRADMATTVKYYLNDGSNFRVENFTHNIKNLDSKTAPMIVQVVENEAGCSDTTYQILKIKPAFSLYVPDAFTPNGDGINDEFQAKGVGVIEFYMQIYDRWGHIVFATDNMLKTWDGRKNGSFDPIKQDVYTWRAQVLDIHRKKHILVGHVTLVN